MPPLQLVAKLQTRDHACGNVVADIVFDFLGVRSRTVPSTPIDGTSPDTLESTLWSSGVRVQAGSMDLDDLKYHTRRGRPVICLVVTDDNVGHWVVVSGIERGKVCMVDPLVGDTREPTAAFLKRWSAGDSTRRGVHYTQWAIAAGP